MNTIPIINKELEIIDQIMIVPIYASGVEELVNKTNLSSDYILKLHLIVKDCIDGKIEVKNISESDYKNLIKVFTASIEIAKEFDDLHTLTGYTESEINELKKKLSDKI